MIGRTNAGGSGSGGAIKPENAIIIATVPAGSTVTATKGNISLTPTMWTTAADASMDCALFVVPSKYFDSENSWTITSIDGEDNASEDLIINTNKEYSIELQYKFYLFKSGKGAVTQLRTASASSSYKWDITTARMYIQGGDGWGGRGIQSINEIDLTDYTQLVVDGYRSSPGGGNFQSASFITHTQIKSDNTDGGASGQNRVAAINLPTSRGIIRTDISSYDTAYYVTIGGCWTMYIYNWWLE